MPNAQQRSPLAAIGETTSRRSLAIWIWSTLIVLDTVLLTRRLSGEFQSALPAWAAFIATTIVAAISLTGSVLYSSTDRAEPRNRRRLMQGLCLVPTLVWVMAISANARPLTAGLLAGIVLTQALFLVVTEFELNPVSTEYLVAAGKPGEAIPVTLAAPVEPVLPSSTVEPVSPSSMTLDSSEPFESDEIDEELDAEVDQSQTHWMSRRLTEEGDVIEGWVRVPFEAAQRETIVHVSFCPPLAGSPAIETHDLDGAGLEIRTAAIFPFGARLSVRCSGRLETCQHDRVGFVVHASTETRAA